MTITLRGGVETTDPRLDRVPQFDQRSRSFSMAAVIEATEKTYKRRSYTWSIGKHLDQGSEGACVGFSWAHELIARPAVVDVNASYARWIYKIAQKYDYWAGEAYEGTSVIAGAQVIQKRPPAMNEGRGLIDQYRWIFGNLDDLIKTLGYFGPVIFGINWYEGMFDTDSDGFLHVTGRIAGGHAIIGKGVSLSKKAVLLHNSWGESWGQGGDAWISFDDIIRLLHEQGECCVPVRRHS